MLKTLLSQEKLITITQCLGNAPGHAYAAEFGVYDGGSLEHIARYDESTTCFGIDSFEGLPTPGMEDLHLRGEFATSNFEALRKYFSSHHENVILVQGYSPDVFSHIGHAGFHFVHIDVDLYQSTRDAIEFFAPRMVVGGIMLFDDYTWQGTPGVDKALAEWKPDNFHFKPMASTYQFAATRIK